MFWPCDVSAFLKICSLKRTDSEEDLTEGQNVERQVRWSPSMHVIHRKLQLETLDTEDHRTGTEAVRPQNKFVKMFLVQTHFDVMLLISAL